MTQSIAEVMTANGRKGSVDLDMLNQAAASELVCVQMDNNQQVWVVSETLAPQSDGRYLLPIAVPDAPHQPDSSTTATETTVIPVVAEQVVVGKRQVHGEGVRVSKIVHERQETVKTSLTHQETDVTRVPVGEFVGEPEQTREEGDTLIVPVYEEVLVVEKRLRLRERLLITKRLVETTEEQPVTLRAEEAIVERLVPGPSHAENDGPAN